MDILGDDNLYPQWLNRLFYESPYQSGIIRQKVFFIAGGGYEIEFESEEDKVKWDEFESNMPMGSTIKDLVSDNTLDSELYNGFAIKGARNKSGGISYLESLDFDKVRTNKKETAYYYSDDWSVSRQDDSINFKEYKPYNPLNIVDNFIIYYKYPSKEFRKAKRRTDMGLYPKPSYSGGLKDISTDIEMSSYHFHEILNGLKTGTIIYLGNGEPSDPTDKSAIEEQIKEGSTGVETTGGVILMYGKGTDQKPEVLHLNGNDLDRRYLMTEEAVQKKILLAHSVVTPTLFGIQKDGQLGNATELENGYNIFIKTYVRARQEVLEDAYTHVLNKVLKIKGKFILKEGELLDEKEDSTPDETVNPLEQTKHSKDSILDSLNVAGVPRKEFLVVSRKEMPSIFNSEDAIGVEIKHWREVDKETYYFAELLTDFQLKVLNSLSQEDEEFDKTAIAKLLKTTVSKVEEAYDVLREKNLIKKNSELTDRGVRALESSPANVEKFEVRYSYEEKANALPTKDGKSRPFCTALMGNPRMYTRQEIDLIATGVRRDVWAYRGGWYTNPQTKQHTPFCRHVWVQNIVFRP